MSNSIFITTNLNKGTGGGNVSRHELNVLLQNTDVKLILADHESNEYKVPVRSINPQDHNLPKNEFLWDYLAHEKVDTAMKGCNIGTLFINGNPFGKTVDHIKKSQSIRLKTIVSVPAHDLQESINEHNKINSVKYDQCYPHMTDPFLWKMQTEHIINANVIVTPSLYSVEALKKLNLIKNQEIKVIPHGVDLPRIEDVKPIPDEFIVGYIGSCLSDKGIIYAISAWNHLAYEDGLFIYAGSHETYFREYIQSIQPQKGARYMVIGFIPDVKELYNNISVYVQPAVTEGFGLEVLEAMSYGRPVICSDGAGAHELIENGINGFVFPKRDVNKLMEYVQYFKDNPTEINVMGNNARKTAQKYTWDSIEEQYAGLFK